MNRLIEWLKHKHDWECLEAEPSEDKEEYWYWHYEVCKGCPKRRHVLNHGENK